MMHDKTLFNHQDDERLRGKSLSELLADPTFSVYFGTTKRLWTQEWLRWLTTRGCIPEDLEHLIDEANTGVSFCVFLLFFSFWSDV